MWRSAGYSSITHRMLQRGLDYGWLQHTLFKQEMLNCYFQGLQHQDSFMCQWQIGTRRRVVVVVLDEHCEIAPPRKPARHTAKLDSELVPK